MSEDFKETVIDMSREFDENEGYVTCEVSILKETIPEMDEFVKANTNIKYGKWVATECDTCVGYHGEGYIHMAIEVFDIVTEIEASSNFIKTLNK